MGLATYENAGTEQIGVVHPDLVRRLFKKLWGRNGQIESRPPKPCDEVMVCVEGIGKLTNMIMAWVDPHPGLPARRRSDLAA